MQGAYNWGALTWDFMRIMHALRKALCPTLKGFKWGYLIFKRKRKTVKSVLSLVVTAHAVIRKWVLLTDPDDKMAGVKVRQLGKKMQILPCELCYILVNISFVQIQRLHCTLVLCSALYGKLSVLAVGGSDFLLDSYCMCLSFILNLRIDLKIFPLSIILAHHWLIMSWLHWMTGWTGEMSVS